MSSTTSPAYPAATFAKLFELSERRIQQLAKEGIIPKPVNGNYGLVGTVKGYMHYLQARAQGRIEAYYADPTDIRRERKRLIKAQADNAECEHQIKRGTLVALALVVQVLQEVAILYGSSLDALPGRLAQEFAGINDSAVIKNRLFDECRHIRNLTSEHLERFAKIEESDLAICPAGQSTPGEDA